MFIHYLNLDQQSALYHFSKQLIAVDGHIDERENLLLETIVSQCSDNANLDKSYDLVELSSLFSKHSEKMAFLLELVGVGYADQVLKESENDFIKHISETIGVDLSRIEEMKGWVQRQLALVTEAQNFLEE
ncbi:TerB family tellurite resistance protein [Marinospirillum sp.]|uniref:TerB family tellurite resistance protein n=1 Tax=Marinospirillum sp. TaxID=2183934 RepID=UPI00384E2201